MYDTSSFLFQNIDKKASGGMDNFHPKYQPNQSSNVLTSFSLENTNETSFCEQDTKLKSILPKDKRSCSKNNLELYLDAETLSDLSNS